ncbi:hypothetical protein GSY74_09120 [Sulfurovum sp. bin170]|uniref:hypothetical protein n=1 Tax=Sulfurovum sp. bin170 TaxID=2695268 RepID=UPI0013E02056|nr:hypothetical protein [Sulfurovum sp. bin170]NEW61441.1 hypothetical protein [Sulfurovum sp. bin170]
MKGAIVYLLVIVGFIYFLIQHGEDESSRKSERDAITACQKEVIFFKMVHNRALVKKAQMLLYDENYEIVSTITKAEHMKSRIETYLSKENVDKVVQRVIKNSSKADGITIDSEKVTIKYLIVENDKHHPIKRNGKVDFFIGYLDFKFLLGEELVYESQIDYIGKTGEDIPRRIECVVNSFIALEAFSPKKKR